MKGRGSNQYAQRGSPGPSGLPAPHFAAERPPAVAQGALAAQWQSHVDSYRYDAERDAPAGTGLAVWQHTATAGQIKLFMSWLKPLSREKQHHIQQVLKNPACPPAIVAQIWEIGSRHRGDDMWLGLAKHALEHQNMPEGMLVRLLRERPVLRPTTDIGIIVHRNAALPTKVFESIVDAPEPWVREVAAARTDCPAPVLDRLLRDHDRRVARAAANNPNLPPSVRAMWQLANGGT
jgi:hypothetical protein